ncbi:glutaminyl-peptide cyclotransferase [Arenibacter latericius]|uniref:glutaminyl-peptide cyclotransferase n=1 Tax=Arenibacter latericius TaxID=86104 RepID=UPI000401CE0B|nr:glutaminyl-peptide cyclotransferase [Arenibacter latericius]MDX1362849.1 glutaminyl-peptide cyclotransferase [Arenibacter latericius]
MISNKINLLFLFPIFFVACGGNTDLNQLFEIQLEGNKTEFKKNDVVNIAIANKKNKEIDKVTYYINNTEVAVVDNKIELNLPQLGAKTITANISFDGGAVEINKDIKLLAENAPEIYTYEIINEFPHDNTAYTQGLEFYNDTLYESTGRKGHSSLRKVDYKTGKVLQKIALEDQYFGEGITIMNGKIYQLTWQSGVGFIYDLDLFKKIDSFKYNQSKEGWGLCNDGTTIFKSDGTEKIWSLNPETMAEEGYFETVTNTSIFNRANELEYVDGKIYANVYQKESMMIIDAKSGAIEGVVNFGGLKDKVTQHQNLDVLNGVAYHPERKTFFVTGKNWDKLFEVNIVKK